MTPRGGPATRHRRDAALSLYPIGAVAALTGLSTNTIRAWERRYDAVIPERSAAGGRRYSDEDVERLQLLRRLTQDGCSIGTVASLGTEELRTRLSRFNPHPAAISPTTARVALVHRTLSERMGERRSPAWDVIVQAGSVDALAAGAGDERHEADVLIVDLDLLGARAGATLERCIELTGARHTIVLYHFAQRRRLTSLAASGARLVQEPLPLVELFRLVDNQVALPDSARATDRPARVASAPRFTAKRLAKLREIVTRVDCECPNHLATLVTSLNAFERYTAACESANEPDRVLHQTLHEGVRGARGTLEELLSLVCEHDGIEL